MHNKFGFLISIMILLLIFFASCNNQNDLIENEDNEPIQINERLWVGRVAHIDDDFASDIPDDVLDLFAPLLDMAKADGLPDEENRIGVEECWFYSTGENSGFVTKGYRHWHALYSSLFETYYFDGNEYVRIYQNEEMRFGTGISDGEFLFYIIDNYLMCLDKNGEIKRYPVLEYNSSMRFHQLKGDGDEIIIEFFNDQNPTIIINVK